MVTSSTGDTLNAAMKIFLAQAEPRYPEPFVAEEVRRVVRQHLERGTDTALPQDGDGQR